MLPEGFPFHQFIINLSLNYVYFYVVGNIMAVGLYTYTCPEKLNLHYKRDPYLVCIQMYVIVQVTDNYPTWVRGIRRMAVEIIPWPNHKLIWLSYGPNKRDQVSFRWQCVLFGSSFFLNLFTMLCVFQNGRTLQWPLPMLLNNGVRLSVHFTMLSHNHTWVNSILHWIYVIIK